MLGADSRAAGALNGQISTFNDEVVPANEHYVDTLHIAVSPIAASRISKVCQTLTGA